MGEELSEKLRQMNNRQHRGIDSELFVSKVQNCYGTVRRLVDKEMEKGKSVFDALDTVLNSKAVGRICPELKEQSVSRKIRKIIIGSCIAKQNRENQGIRERATDEIESER